MNIKLIALASAVAVSAAVAQDFDENTDSSATESTATEETSTEEAAEAPAPAPAAPAVEEAAAEESTTEAAPAEAPAEAATGLGVLHGVAYNTIGNEAAASTFRGNMATPYKMAGSKMVYVEPSNEYGAVAFTAKNLTYLLAFNNYGDLGMITAGIATSSFGVTVDLSLAKNWGSEEHKTTETDNTDVSMTEANDYLGVTFAMPLGKLDLTANAYWETYQNEADADDGDNSLDVDYWNLGASVTVSNSPSGSTFAWSAGLWFQRHTDDKSTEMTNLDGSKATVESTNPGANILIQPNFNFGLPILSNQDAQVLIGLNTRLPVVIFDEIDNDAANAKDNYSIFALYTQPNLLAEMSLTENWIIFGEAGFEWKVFSYASDELSEANSTSTYSLISMKTFNTTAAAGARFQYKSLALEASVADNLSSSAWAGLVGKFSGTLSF